MNRKILPIEVNVCDKFWSTIIERNSEVTVPVCLKRCEETGRISNFANAALDKKGSFQGRFYNDACLYKVIEGVANTLKLNPNPVLEETADNIINKIAAAQMNDGYIMTYFQLQEPENRWTDMGMHEMYCAGHLLEAAIAYYEATRKVKLLCVAIQFIEHIMCLFGEGKRHWVPGHEEIELALVKLYDKTGEKKYLEFSKWLIDQRGKGLSRGRDYSQEFYNTKYNQDDIPFVSQRIAKGHAVRAMYLYSAAADIAYETGDNSYISALLGIWDNVVQKNMYITGGIGSTKFNEGFSTDYNLPNKTAYCETCASVGMVLWNYRMWRLTEEAKYFDIAERAMYNGVLSGVSITGDLFFYDNVLESDGDKKRSPWFTTSCCPTQIARFIPTVGSYFYMNNNNCLWINMYGSSQAKIEIDKQDIIVIQKTDYPYDGKVEIIFHTKNKFSAKVKLRIPGWCDNWRLHVNSAIKDAAMDKGYLTLDREWSDGDVITLALDMPVKLNYSHECVEENKGKAAISRGPLVYCIEEIDNMQYDDVKIDPHGEFSDISATINTADNINTEDPANDVNTVNSAETRFIRWDVQNIDAVAVPYHLWNNRGQGKMKVWIPLIPSC
ncbi:MAG TPA: glycoside hydrolase family 127 protein [Clostridiales bacterium]|nr:glycoside hydrolase family 127 protein [Clostridiales bacterium]